MHFLIFSQNHQTTAEITDFCPKIDITFVFFKESNFYGHHHPQILKTSEKKSFPAQKGAKDDYFQRFLVFLSPMRAPE